MKLHSLLKSCVVLTCLVWATFARANSLSDYGAIPALSKPQQDQLDANERLDFHTDRFTGRFAYSVPIEVPPARGGSEPGIALQYNSANKNGWCGVGWDLDMGYIQRDTRKGVSAVPSGGRSGSLIYTNSMGFVFSIAGQSGRLINVSGTSYSPQIDTGFLNCAFSNGWWICTDKSGRKYNFGESDDSRITNSLGTFKWALSSITDPNGNLTLLQYTRDLGQLYLKEIDYNGNTTSPAIATNSAVVFDLASTNRLDIISSLISGSEIQTRKLLTGIRVLHDGELVRRYALAYTTSPSTDRLLLHKVTEYGSDDDTSLPPRTFTYSEQAHSFKSASTWNVTAETADDHGTIWDSSPGNPDTTLKDMNGDGLPDWVTVGSGLNHYNVQLNTGSGFSSSQSSWATLSNEGSDGTITWNALDNSLANGDGSLSSICQLVDINGDGIADRVLRGYSTRNHFQVQTNTGAGWASRSTMSGVSGADSSYQATTTMTSDGEASRSLMMDMNGDGLPDHVMLGSANGRFDVQLNSGSSFGGTTYWGNVESVGSGSYPYAPRNLSALDLSGHSYVNAELMDMNGDGLPDRLMIDGVQLNDGVDSFDSFSSTWGFSGNPEVTDVSNGSYSAQWLDMNGDGLPDLVEYYSDGTFEVWFNTGRKLNSTGVFWSNVDTSKEGTSGWNSLQSWDSAGLKVLFLDMNGDGLIDRVKRKPNTPGSFLVQLNSGPFPDLLTNIDNGIDGTVGVTYEPSTSYDNSDGVRSRLPFPVYVVTSVKAKDSHGSSGITSYTYAGGLYDTTYREFRGFAVVTQTRPLNDYTITWFHQGGGTNAAALGEFDDDLAKAGMAYRIESYGSNDKLYTRTINKVDEVQLSNKGVFFPFVRQTVTEDFEGNTGGNYRATAAGYAYDATSNNLADSTGNLLSQTNYGEVLSVNIKQHSFTTTNNPAPVYRQYTYASIPSNPDIIDRVASVTVSADASGSVVLKQTTNAYYDVTGNLESSSDLICPGIYATTAYTYDDYGNLATVTDPVGVVTTTEYDSDTATYPARKYTGNLSDNLIESFQYDPGSGALLFSTNMQGLVTGNDYDVFFRLTNSAISTVANGTPTLWRTRIEYTLNGMGNDNSHNFIRVLKNDPADSANGYHETYTYFDGLGRPIQVRDEAETGGYRVSNISYDDAGNVVLQQYPIFDTGSGYEKYSGATTNIYTEYDKIGRAFRVNPVAKATFTANGWWNGSDPNVQSGDSGSPVDATTVAFKEGNNPWVLIVTNALGNARKYYLDAFGRTNEIVEVTSQGDLTSYLNYDPVGNLTNITDNADNQTTFYYNDIGQRVAMTDPDMGFWQYGLDAAGRLKVQTDAKNQKLKFYYDDPAGRLTRREAWNAYGQCVATNLYYYDTNNGDGDYTVYPGQLYSFADAEGWQKFSYDVRGRALKTTRYLSKNGNSYTTQSTYDDADRLNSTIYPNGGPTVTNLFDTGENLSEVKQVGGAGTTYYTTKGFNSLGQSLGVNFGNGVETTIAYYSVSHRLDQISTANTTNIQNLSYTYDAIGNIKSVADGVYSGSASAAISSINYDDLNRLLSATWSVYGTKNYGYDSVGNVQTNGESGTGNYVYNTVRPHTVKSANGRNYAYDLNGNVAVRGTERLSFNPENRLAFVASTNLIVSFGYDADGARLWKQNGTNLQVWIGNIYEEKNGRVLYHIYAGGRLVCTFDKTGTNVFEYYHPDNLTSTAIQTDTNGNPVQHYEYSAFGQSRYTQSASAFPVSRRYTSQVLDEDTGLYYYNARYYDPVLGRFIQPDDIIPDLGDPQSWNRYSYVLNNPLRYTDPSGHESQTDLDAAARRMGDAHGHYWRNYSEAAHELGIKGYKIATVGNVEGVVDVGHKAGKMTDAYVNVAPSIAEMGVGAVVAAGTREVAEHAPGMTVKLFGKEASQEAKVATRALKQINLPSLKKITLDMEHIASGHMAEGSRVSSKKTLFPESWARADVEKAVKEAYGSAKKVETQGNRIRLQGKGGGQKIEMWLNTKSKVIETAYPTK